MGILCCNCIFSNRIYQTVVTCSNVSNSISVFDEGVILVGSLISCTLILCVTQVLYNGLLADVLYTELGEPCAHQASSKYTVPITYYTYTTNKMLLGK